MYCRFERGENRASLVEDEILKRTEAICTLRTVTRCKWRVYLTA